MKPCEPHIVIQDKLVRDYFAGVALSGLLQRAASVITDDKLTKLAYNLADAMMKARKA